MEHRWVGGRVLCLTLLLLTCVSAQWSDEQYYDGEGQNDTDTYGLKYGVGLGPTAMMTDDEPAWSVKLDPQTCQNGECSAGDSSSGYDADSYESLKELYAEALKDMDLTFIYPSCTELPGGELFINGTSDCDLYVSGSDSGADLLEGGIDGLYRLTGCHQGKPLYYRVNGPAKEHRCLAYSEYHGDWQFSIGDVPSVDQLVMYGDYGYVSPLDIPYWHVAVAFNTIESTALTSEEEDLYFIAQGVRVECSRQERPHPPA